MLSILSKWQGECKYINIVKLKSYSTTNVKNVSRMDLLLLSNGRMDQKQKWTKQPNKFNIHLLDKLSICSIFH